MRRRSNSLVAHTILYGRQSDKGKVLGSFSGLAASYVKRPDARRPLQSLKSKDEDHEATLWRAGFQKQRMGGTERLSAHPTVAKV